VRICHGRERPASVTGVCKVELEEVAASARALEHRPFPGFAELVDPSRIQLARKIAATRCHHDLSDARMRVSAKTSA
jgi:hypothetical protein